MSLYYNVQCIGRHIVTVLRVFFVTNVGAQLYEIYFNYHQLENNNQSSHDQINHSYSTATTTTIHNYINNSNSNSINDTITTNTATIDTIISSHNNYNLIINELIENGWTKEAATIRYILLKNCESIIPLIALASCIVIISRYIHKLFLSFMLVDDAESASTAGILSGWLFIIMCLQCGITSLPDEDRYWRLLRNFGLIVIVNLHSLFKPVSDRLQSLSASRSKTIHKHARVLFVGLSTILLPTWFLVHLWSQKSISSWTLTVTVFGFEMIFRVSYRNLLFKLHNLKNNHD